MSHQVIWTKFILERFISEGNLSPEEEHVMRMRAACRGNVEISMSLHMSIRTVERIVQRLKKKYDAVAAFDPLLPPRKETAAELYMDTH